MSVEATVMAQYGQSGLAEAILDAAERVARSSSSRDLGRLNFLEIARFDELHVGGARATLRLLLKLGIAAGTHWLDVGAGVGGAGRLAVWFFGCRVTGIDLTSEFCAAANVLTRKAGMSGNVHFVQGNALAMPFADGAFDGGFTLHAGMNIDDKPGLYRAVHRALKPGATFGIYDILAGPAGGELTFPVPWAATPDANFLVGIEEMRAMLEEAGFAVLGAEDRTAFAYSFYKTMRRRAASELPPVGLQLAMGAEYRRRLENAGRNVIEGRCGPWEIVCRKR